MTREEAENWKEQGKPRLKAFPGPPPVELGRLFSLPSPENPPGTERKSEVSAGLPMEREEKDHGLVEARCSS
jgi:hypothetical protein